MKKLLLVLVILGVAGGVYYYMTINSKTIQPPSSAMPVSGTSGVEEMISTTVEVSPEASMTDDTKEQTFTVNSFEFGYDKKEITVNKGDIITLTLTNSGKMLHDFIIDELNVKTKQIANGQTDTVIFVAEKEGTFEYYCSVGSHRQMGMTGTLVVQ